MLNTTMLDKLNIWKYNGNSFAKSKDLPQVFALFSASLAGFSGGTLFAFASPAIPKLISDYHFTIEEVSYITVIPPIAMIIATPLFCKLADKFGRKYTLLSAGVLHIISWILVSFAQSIYVFYVSRIFHGISDACLFSTLPVYIAEVTTPKVRSLYGSMMMIFINIGQFVANCIGFYFSIPNTAFIMLIFPILFLTTFIFIPETPYYLIMSNSIDDARRSLQRLRNREDVVSELEQLSLDVSRQQSESGSFKDLWAIKSNRKAVIVANLSRLFQQFSGIGSLVAYCQYIFQEAGSDISSGAASMIVTGIMAFAIVFGNCASDKLGRKNSMILSCCGCGVALLSESIYFYLQRNEVVNVSIINWFPVFGLVVYVVIFAVGLAIVPTLMVGEIFSTSIRRHATTVTNMMFGVYICIVTKLFQVMMSVLGMWVPFLVFSLCCFISSIISYFIVPETKGKTLEEIQQILKGKH